MGSRALEEPTDREFPRSKGGLDRNCIRPRCVMFPGSSEVIDLSDQGPCINEIWNRTIHDGTLPGAGQSRILKLVQTRTRDLARSPAFRDGASLYVPFSLIPSPPAALQHPPAPSATRSAGLLRLIHNRTLIHTRKRGSAYVDLKPHFQNIHCKLQCIAPIASEG